MVRSPSAFALLLAGLASALAAPIDKGTIRVVDGDTIRILNEPEDTRLVGFNAPETSHPQAKCAAEIELGSKAADAWSSWSRPAIWISSGSSAPAQRERQERTAAIAAGSAGR